MTALLTRARTRALCAFFVLAIGGTGAATASAETVFGGDPDREGRLAFVTNLSTISTIRPDGSNLKPLGPADVGEPAISPDGTRIAFVQAQRIMVKNADGTGLVQDLSNAGLPAGTTVNDFSPAWSGDGSKIAFSRRSQIWVMDADGTDQVQLTDTPLGAGHPAWSPTASKIAYAASDGGSGPEINVMNADGSGAKPITSTAPGENHQYPDWSPDGTEIAFDYAPNSLSQTDGQARVVRVSDGAVRTVASLTRKAEGGPSWDPTGNWLAYTDVNFNILRVSKTGGAPVTLHDAATVVRHVDWGENYDRAKPEVVVRTPLSGQRFPVGRTVLADFECRDTGSGLATGGCTGTPADGTPLATSSAGLKDFTAQARDNAGNFTKVDFKYEVFVDNTAPSVVYSPAIAGQTYERGENVTVNYECEDDPDGLGVEQCVGDVESGGQLPTSKIGQNEFSVETSDGTNSATRTVSYTVVDTTDPTVTLTTPADGATYEAGDSVIADYACSDGPFPVVCDAPVEDGDAIATSTPGDFDFTVTASDEATPANTASVTHSYSVEDTRMPSAEITSPTANQEIEIHDTVNSAFTCSDPNSSGIATCLGKQGDASAFESGAPLDTSTLGQKTLTVTATDRGGNTFQTAQQYEVVDTVDPTAEVSAPTEGQRIAIDETSTATFTCADDGGSGVESCVGKQAGRPDIQSGERIDTSTLGAKKLTVVATDKAGNESDPVVVNYEVVDVTDPTASITTPTANQEVEFGDSVASDFDCTDPEPGSGIESCVGTQEGQPPLADGDALDSTSSLGTKTLTVVATDKAGNESEPVSVDYTVVDTKKPTAQIAQPTEDQAIAIDADAPAVFSCSDGAGSGVESCIGKQAGKPDLQPGDPLDTSSYGQKTLTVVATDKAGNESDPASVSYRVVDVTDPKAPAITTPADEADFLLGETVNADYACEDNAGGIGIDTCLGTVPDGDPIDTDDVGPHSFEVTATDRHGNTAETVHTYDVLYRFSGFKAPVSNLPTVNVMKAGRAVPVKFSLGGYKGMGVIADRDSVRIDCSNTLEAEEVPTTLEDGSSELTYDASSDLYQFVWKTSGAWAGQCRDLRVTLDDGETRRLRFQFK